MSDRTIEAVRRYGESACFNIASMFEFAPGVVGAFDSTGEFDAYFDRAAWGPSDPGLWGDSLYPPGLNGTGLGVLPGVGMAPPPRNFSELFEFAKQGLKSRTRDRDWYDTPRPVCD